jgi:hypothetical protein
MSGCAAACDTIPIFARALSPDASKHLPKQTHAQEIGLKKNINFHGKGEKQK